MLKTIKRFEDVRADILLDIEGKETAINNDYQAGYAQALRVYSDQLKSSVFYKVLNFFNFRK